MIPTCDIDWAIEWDRIVEDCFPSQFERPRWFKEDLLPVVDSIVELAISLAKHVDDEGYVALHNPIVRAALITFKLACEELEDAL